MGYPIDAMCAMCDKTDEYLTVGLCPACHREVHGYEPDDLDTCDWCGEREPGLIPKDNDLICVPCNQGPSDEVREEMQRSADKIIASLQRWPNEEERLDSYWEDHEYG